MKRIWIGIALCAASWLYGLDYYHKAAPLIWLIFLAGGTVFFLGTACIPLSRMQNLIALIVIFPVALFTPLPYAVILWMLWVGLALQLLPLPVKWTGKAAQALLMAGLILLFQSAALALYENWTAGSHEVPQFLTAITGTLTQLLGIDTGILTHNIALFTMRKSHQIGITWELFFDPVTFLFFTGVLVVFIHQTIVQWDNPASLKKRFFPLLKLVLCLLLWLPLRTVFYLTLLIHRLLITGYDDPLVIMNQFWNPLMHLGLLTLPVLFCWRFIPLFTEKTMAGQTQPRFVSRQNLPACIFAFLSVFLLFTGFNREPAGKRKAGRILIDEYHSTWEPVDKPFDTTWYGQDSGYNYWCMYNYLAHYYTMGRLDKPLSTEQLKNTDVLIVKVPTSGYDKNEIQAVKQFVKAGGGLLLIAEHTDVFKTTTYINDLAELFGFEFEKDILLGIDTPFEQLYVPAAVPHPITRHMPPLNFAVSCSISAPPFSGSQVIRSTGLRRLYADYHVSNFYPAVEDYADVRYGAFIQLFAKQAGKGRVAAFTDSTIFSNFCTFEPGKIELLTGMVEWLNRTPELFFLKVILIITGFAGFFGFCFFARKNRQYWFLFFCCMLLGSFAGMNTARALNQALFPLPEPHTDYVQVHIDRTVSTAPLSNSGFIKGEEKGFGIFEQWILRLGYYLKRPQIQNEFNCDLLVFFYPEKTIPAAFREKLVQYVREGGKLLILDSARNLESSANSLLYPFGIRISNSGSLSGQVNSLAAEHVELPVEAALPIAGGVPFLTLDHYPVGVQADYGQGTVTVLTTGDLFTDAKMGVTTDTIPGESLIQVFEFEYSLIRAIVEKQLPGREFKAE